MGINLSSEVIYNKHHSENYLFADDRSEQYEVPSDSYGREDSL